MFEVFVKDLAEMNRLLLETEQELARLVARKSELLEQISELQQREALPLHDNVNPPLCDDPSLVTNQSSPEAKIALFRSLFRGREDVYPKRFESMKTGKSGYQPACRNEWVEGICEKKKIRCEECSHRDFLPATDAVVRNHLLGRDSQSKSEREFTIGVYPMLHDETCWFLAADFDKSSWREDARAFVETCRLLNVPAALERSRSGNGGHIWIFFSEPVPVSAARKVGTYLLTQTMERRPEIGLDSYDRFFPSQDTLPKGWFWEFDSVASAKKGSREGQYTFSEQGICSTPRSMGISFIDSPNESPRC